jgi:signal transduction histidine kinase
MSAPAHSAAMHRSSNLFWRMFVSFFVVSAATLSASFWFITRATLTHDFLREHAAEAIEAITRGYAANGGVGLDTAHDQLRAARQINAYLVRGGKLLGARPVPPPVQERIGDLRAEIETEFTLANGGRMLSLPIKLAQPEPAHVVLFEQRENNAISSKSLLAWQLVALLFAVAAAGWWIAHALSSPIALLQSAVNRMAAGDLDTRVSGALDSNVTELIGLGRDFDYMAARMQTMIAARDRLLHGISHEMRSPLARLRLHAELLRAESGAQHAARLGAIDREISRIDTLVDEILTMARLERADVLIFEHCPLAPLIEDGVRSAMVEAEASRIGIVVHTDDLTIPCAPPLLARAIDNLLRNAIQYAPAESRIEVCARAAGACVEISVADMGPGVPEAALKDIFDPFYRASNAAHDGGYGLGLAFVRQVAALHGGTAEAQNREGGGLRVTLRLPIAPHKITSPQTSPASCTASH